MCAQVAMGKPAGLLMATHDEDSGVEHEQDQASGARDIAMMQHPHLEGSQLQLKEGLAHPSSPQQQHPQSPSALTGDSTRKGEQTSNFRQPVTQSAGTWWPSPYEVWSPHNTSVGGLLSWLRAQRWHFPHILSAAKSCPVDASCHSSQHQYFTQQK